MLAPNQSFSNRAQEERACHSSSSFVRIISRPCMTEFLLARGFGKFAPLLLFWEKAIFEG
jgi:hypothetical protein